MYRYLLFIPLISVFQTLDDRLASRWKLIWDDGVPVEEVLELNFKKDYTFERLKHGKITEGKWKIVSGKEKSLIEIIFISKDKKNQTFFEIRFSGDTLFLQSETENSVFLKIK